MTTTIRNFPAPLPVPRLGFVGSLVLGAMRLVAAVGGRVAVGPTADWAHGLYFSPRRYPASGREREALKTGTPLTIPYRSPGRTPYPGGDLVGWSWGTGPTVLLVHGWESRGSWIAEPYVEALVAAGFRVVTWDMPGHGGSPGVRSDVDSFATGLAAVAGVVGPIHAVIAHSLGAAATSIALHRGLAIGRVAYVGPACWMLSFPDRFSAVMRLPPKARAALWERLFRTFPEADWAGLSGDALATRMTVPALIVHDRRDAEVHFEGGEAIARGWPGARFVATEGLGHRRIIADAAVKEQVLAFVRG